MRVLLAFVVAAALAGSGCSGVQRSSDEARSETATELGKERDATKALDDGSADAPGGAYGEAEVLAQGEIEEPGGMYGQAEEPAYGEAESPGGAYGEPEQHEEYPVSPSGAVYGYHMPQPPPAAAALAAVSAAKAGSGNAARIRGDADTVAARIGAPQPGEELWIIVRHDKPAPAGPREYPTLKAKRADQNLDIPLPLEHTDVDAHIAGYIATVGVKQRYGNPYSEKIEAVYVFPLPEDAAVQEFVMTVGERRIRGIIREREEAEQLYAEAKHGGYTASLLTQERPNVFTQSVANIEPGASIDIDLKYFHTVKLHDGEYEFVFPMVVGPRYNMPGTSGGIGAMAAGQNGASGQRTEVTYLQPERERSGHDVMLAVEIEGGMKVESIRSPSHTIKATRDSDSLVRVALERRDKLPNEDFVLRYKLAGKTSKSALLTHHDDRGGFFTLMLEPPAALDRGRRQPMELIFVLDCSGSMEGKPIEIAKAAAERALGKLRSEDSFQIISFSDATSQLGKEPLRATSSNVKLGIEYLRSLGSGGGTNMMAGIVAALNFPHDPKRMRIVSFLTDGFIGQDSEIIGAVARGVGDARVFSLGVGSSVNRYLLEGMARVGHGAAAFVGIDEGYAGAIDQFYERVSHPALTDVEIDWGTLAVADVYPSRVPDLFVGRPVVLTGRLLGNVSEATVRVSGRVGSRREELAVKLRDNDRPRPGIPAIWARTRIGELEDVGSARGKNTTAAEITDLALEHSLMSAYTAFVAVDATERTAGDHGVTVVQPVPMPKGVSYETTVR